MSLQVKGKGKPVKSPYYKATVQFRLEICLDQRFLPPCKQEVMSTPLRTFSLEIWYNFSKLIYC